MIKRNEELENRVIDVLGGVTPTFSTGEETFTLYPKTLGKMYLFDRLRDKMELNTEAMKENPIIEVLRVCKEKKDSVLRMLAYATLHGKENVFDEEKIQKRLKSFESINNNDLAALMLSLLMDNDIQEFIKYFDIDKDDENRRKIVKAKEKNNVISFGGRSVWGTLIDFACARYGWTLEYVVWEISYTNLMMLYKDKPETAYLTDKERKSVRLREVGNVINGDDPNNFEKIKKMFS